MLALSSCSGTNQNVPDTPLPKTKEQKKKKPAAASATTHNSDVTPTPEQQEAAQEILETTEGDGSAAIGEAPGEEMIETPAPAAESETTSDTIPGGLRMGQFAPPEEGTGDNEHHAHTPNSVELHGFRSPSLRGGKLPMNINGKLNTNQ